MKTSDNRMVNSFMIGVGLGLLAGVLWAPRPGKETRNELLRGADDGLTYLREESDKIRKTTDSWVTRLQGFFCRSARSG
jgi:gas vesicle protein